MSKIYELPISSNYVHNWGIPEAIRELLQNAIDSETDGHKMVISFNNSTLAISNLGCNLSISSLVLGQTNKVDPTKYIGTYGEGYKLALVVLLRNNLKVRVYTNGQMWVPTFAMSSKFKVETLHIEVLTGSTVDQITFEIEGLSIEDFEAIRQNSLAMSKAMGYNIGATIPTQYGDILVEPRYRGKMFVNGLYVQTDYSFQYGYDFKPEYLQLDRDRRAINYYKARELTAKALTSQSNVQLVRQAITKSYTDVRDILDHIDTIPTEFKVNFAKEFMTSHHLDEDTFVGLENETKVVATKKVYVVDSNAIAQLVNAGLGKLDDYREIKQKASQLSTIEQAKFNYQGSDYQHLIEYLYEHRSAFNIDELVTTLKSLPGLYPPKFSLIADEVFDEFYNEEGED